MKSLQGVTADTLTILYIVSRKDYEFLWDEKYDNKVIMNVYIGKLKPSERNTKKIVLRIE